MNLDKSGKSKNKGWSDQLTEWFVDKKKISIFCFQLHLLFSFSYYCKSNFLGFQIVGITEQDVNTLLTHFILNELNN